MNIEKGSSLNDTPYLVVRAISDVADEDSHLSFPEFVKMAADNSVKILTEYFNGL